MVWKVGNNTTYILRYYLPADPTYSEEVSCRRGEELVAYCIENQIPAVMLYVDLSPHWYYAPDTLERQKQYAQLLKPLIEKLRKNHISYQLNYQNLFGAGDGGADLTYMNDWEYWVDEKGCCSTSTACHIGPKFRKIAGQKLKMWAQTRPDVIWIDDDIRFHNHSAGIRDVWAGRISGGRTDYGCFCDAHIALFNKRYQLSCTREEIEKGILEGSELRIKWLDFSRNMANEVCEWIENTIHEVSPDTRVAVMTSVPDCHSVEGRDWKEFLTALSKPHKPLLRPHFGPYMEGNPLDFYNAYLYIEQLKENIGCQYGKDVDFCPEIENTRFTRWAKSLSATGLQLMLSAYLGCKGITLSIYDLEGVILQEDPQWAELLNQMRPVYDALCEYDLWDWSSEGVGLITAPDRIAECGKQVSLIQELARGRQWDGILTKAGIPCKYITPDQIDNSNGVALDGYTAGLLREEEIRIILSKGVLLDAGAAEVLCQKGFSKEIGVTVGPKVECIANCEILDTYTRGDGSPVRISARINGYKWNQLELKGASQISTLLTPDGNRYAGMTYYENDLGGKVYVYASNGSVGDGFYTNYRMQFIKEICQNITGNSLVEIDNGSYALTASKAKGNEKAVYVANMSADKMKTVKITFPGDVKEAVFLTQDGKRMAGKVDKNIVSCNGCDLQLYQGLVCIAQF